MTAPARRQGRGDSGRNRYLAAVHAGAKMLGWDEEQRRDVMAARYGGKRSARDLTDTELRDFARYIGDQGGNPKKRRQPVRAGKRPLAPGAEASKVRALWLSLYHLGELADPSEAALDAWVQRQTGGAKQSLRFAERDEVDRLIRGLRHWCARVGFEQPTSQIVHLISFSRWQAGIDRGGDGIAAKVALIHAQWAKLQSLGVDLQSVPAGLLSAVRRSETLSAAEADRTIEGLGAWIRGKTKCGLSSAKSGANPERPK